MCEQTPMGYKQGDVVWVKLGPCWWPGEVISFEELPSDITESFKKPPLAVVKFFNEENYEFVRNLSNIYLYNCHKKYEFIKKGLDLHRAKNSFMEKFPSDVCTAEGKTDGNPNILNDPQLAPEKRTDYTEIFGLSTPKRSPKDSPRFRNKHSFSKHHSSSGGSSKKRSSFITHPRFLSKGKDDHQVRILIQVSEEAKAPQQEYTCHTCGFKSTRVDVIVLHNKSHIKGVYTPVSISKKTKQPSPKKVKKTKKPVPVPTVKKTEEEERPVLRDFKSDLLAEWNDDEEEEEQSTHESFSETFTKKHQLEDEVDDAKRKKSMKMTYSTTTTLEEDLALVEKGIPLCTESSSDESEDSLPKAKRKVVKSPSIDETSSGSSTKKEQSKTLQAFLDFEKEIAKDNLVIYECETLRKQSPISDESDYAPHKNKRKHDPTLDTIAKKSKASVISKANLLAEWDDDDEDEDLIENEDKSEQAETLKKEGQISKGEIIKESENIAKEKKETSSCFDFNEDEDTELLGRSEEGRKIPRVIPLTSNNKISVNIEANESENFFNSVEESISSKKETEKTDVTVDDEKNLEISERLSTPDADLCNKNDFNNETEAFNNILASTVVPKLPEIPQLLKCEQNFHNISTIKFPDKNANENVNCDVEKREGAPAAIESDDKQEIIARVEEELIDTKVDKEIAEVSVVSANVPEEIIEKGDTNINKEKKKITDDVITNKEPEEAVISETYIDVISEDITPLSESPIIAPLSENPITASVKSVSPKTHISFDFQKTTLTDGAKQTEVATKLTNPKKRFVKTFEDETKNLTEKSQEEQVPEEMRNLKVSKLKTLLMSKININSYRKKGSAHLLGYEKVSAHKSRSSKSKYDVDTHEISSFPEKVESHTVLGEHSLNPTINEDASMKTSELESSFKEKSDDTTDSSISMHEEIAAITDNTENVDDKRKAFTNLELKNDTVNDLRKEEKIKSNDFIDLHENKLDDALLLESVTASSDLELKIVDEQMQESNILDVAEDETSKSTKADGDSVLTNNADMIRESEVLLQMTHDAAVCDLDVADEKELNHLVSDDITKMIEDTKPSNESGNLTIVNEVDLVDKQVEITAQVEQKPITLSNFSMDFCEDNTDLSDNHNVTIIDKIVPEEKVTNKVQADLGLAQDVEENISSFEINKQVKSDEVIPEEVTTVKTENENEVVDAEKKEKEQELKTSFLEKETSLESEMAKITDANNDNNVLVEHVEESTSSTKLLEILTDVTPKEEKPPGKPLTSSVLMNKPVIKDKIAPAKILNKVDSKFTKSIGKHSISSTSKITGSKLITEKVIKPVVESETLVSVKKVSSKRSYQDVEDIDAFIIQKPLKRIAVSSEVNIQDSSSNVQIAPTQKGKARILQQTIITPAGDIIQPIVPQSQNDDNMFDINSMPIVLDDQILTPESIENMPIVLQESSPPTTTATVKSNLAKKMSSQQVKLLNKTISPAHSKEPSVTKTQTSLIKHYTSNKPTKVHKVYQTGGSKLLKNNPAVITQPGKPGKFIIVPSSSAPTGNKYTVGKRPPIIKRSTPSINIGSPSVTKVQSIAPESTGNKIMIVTNNLGQQQRVLLTPVQQKVPTYPSSSSKVKPMLKNSNVQQKAIAIKESTSVKVSVSKDTAVSQGQVFAPIMTQQLKNVKVDPSKMKKMPIQNQKLYLQGVSPINKPSTSSRTIIIKNPQGQTVKRIQSSDDSLMEQQVAEQIQAINRASAKPMVKETPVKTRTPMKKSSMKKPISESSKILLQSKTHTSSSLVTTSSSNKSSSLPPLAPISPQKKHDIPHSQTRSITEMSETQIVHVGEDKNEEQKRLPHQLVIQDAHGNQTTITEGQILALPSEAIDGQPQSYVLVTLDETGNLAPLNNEALMSLDPNLSLGGDLGNMVLQIDQGATSESEQTQTTNEIVSANNQEVATINPVNVSPKAVEHEHLAENASQNNNIDVNSLQALAINNGDTGQQLIITGDPISTQKFLESLTEGNTDLANLLANTKGNILIQAEGQQILINTDTENQMLLTVNPENLSNVENSEGNGNPIFANQPIKNQDILAAALADTDVFQQDQSISHSPSKVIQSQLSPNSTLYPIHAGNVLETSSMSSPIMTPLEVPSTNNKKIDDEADILSQVPKNVDLPITITDPNISQTVAQQQVVSLMAAELPSTLDLPLAIQDPSMSVTSSEMNSPSFVYSLPALDDAVDINQKTFSSSISMPLLTEDPDDTLVEATPVDASTDSKIVPEETELSLKQTSVNMEEDNKSPTESNPDIELSTMRDDKTELKDNFMDAEGLCTMRGGICNSLSEPPPDMFDFSVGNQNFESSSEAKPNSDMDIPTESPNTTSITNDMKSDLNEDSSSDKSKLDIDSDLKLEESKPLDVLYSVSTNLEMRSHTPSTNTDDSCEIPVQPEIVTDLTLKNFQNESGMTDSNFESNGSSLNDESDI